MKVKKTRHQTRYWVGGHRIRLKDFGHRFSHDDVQEMTPEKLVRVSRKTSPSEGDKTV